MQTYTLKIDGIPPSNNEFMGKTYNYHVYQDTKRLWHWKVKAAITEKPKTPLKKAVVTIRYWFRDERARDPDNYSGKFILDPLVREGFLMDDNFNVIRLELEKGGVDRKNPYVIVEVREE
jgi:Holliday junction resolvase RusA-like endonuclease